MAKIVGLFSIKGSAEPRRKPNLGSAEGFGEGSAEYSAES